MNSNMEQLATKIHLVENKLGEVILGKSSLIRQVLIALLAKGHVLLEGLPGLGKTQLVNALSALCDMRSKRIQFTPDIMPLDITGSYILSEEDGKRSFQFHHGPIFGNLILADEINRASPKTQSALLESMQENRVTVLGNTHPLPTPFWVIATQNPIEMEGTYPLPEAQLDRFMFKLDVTPVSEDVLMQIVSSRVRGELPTLEKVITEDEFMQAIQSVETIPLSEPVAAYIARLVAATHSRGNGDSVVKYGASPRAAIAIGIAARARAFLEQRQTVGFEDVRHVAKDALRHRLILDYQAKLDGITPDQYIDDLLESVPQLQRDAPKSLMEKLG